MDYLMISKMADMILVTSQSEKLLFVLVKPEQDKGIDGKQLLFLNWVGVYHMWYTCIGPKN